MTYIGKQFRRVISLNHSLILYTPHNFTHTHTHTHTQTKTHTHTLMEGEDDEAKEKK
mgnify:CR=1 FL=1